MAVMRVCTCAAENKLSLENLTVSPIEGGDGNREYLVHFIKKEGDLPRNSENFSIKQLCKD